MSIPIETILKETSYRKIEEYLMLDTVKDLEEKMKEYEGEHKINERKDKIVGEVGSQKVVKTTKLDMPFQRKIVNMAVRFLLGEPVTYVLSSSNVKRRGIIGKKEDRHAKIYDGIMDVLVDNKIRYFDKELARRTMSETRAAELWYPKPEGDGIKIKVMLLCKKNGDEVFGHWAPNGDMDALIRKYEVAELVMDKMKKVKKTSIHTKDRTVVFKHVRGSEWEIEKDEPNPYGKITAVLYDQEKAEWEGVQSEIDRFELMMSETSDMNQYFSAPSVLVKGKLEDPPDKETVGKIFQMKGTKDVNGKVEYGDLSYLEWKYYPESLEFERNTLKDIIYSMTETPDLSFNNLKGLTNLSGIAIKLMFMDAMGKAENHQEIFGPGLIRRMNVILAMMKTMKVGVEKDMDGIVVTPKFGISIPRDVSAIIEALSIARGGENLITRKTALENNPLVDDPEKEEAGLMEEEKETEMEDMAGTEEGPEGSPPGGVEGDGV